MEEGDEGGWEKTGKGVKEQEDEGEREGCLLKVSVPCQRDDVLSSANTFFF